MSIQYPYLLHRLHAPVAIQDANGNFVTDEPGWIVVSHCRNEAGRQRKFSKEDGTYLQATHLIHCPVGIAPLQAGERVRVLEEDGTIRLEGEVIFASKDRFHTRLWL